MSLSTSDQDRRSPAHASAHGLAHALVGQPVLHMLCGKIASGKSTLAAELARKPGTVLIAEDEWLSVLFGDQMHTVSDYVRASRKLRDVMGPHVSMLLMSGVSVVLDFPANTRALRGWMRGIYEEVGAGHKLHFLDLEEDICKQRLHARNQAGEHQFAASDAQFHQICAAFQPPIAAEGFDVITYDTDTI